MGKFKKEQNQDTEIFNPRTGEFEPVKSQSKEYQPICEDYTPVDYGTAGKTAPKQNKSVTKYVVIIVVLAIISLFLLVSWRNESIKYNQLLYYAAQLEKQIENTENSSTISKTETVEAPIQTTENGFVIKYVSAEIVHKTKGEPILLVTYEFTNNSDEAASWMWDLRSKAFQNGIECGGYVSHDNINTQMQDNDIKPGTTITIVEGYPLYDVENPITIEVAELFDDEPILTVKISPKDISVKASTIELIAGEPGEYGKELTYNANTEFAETIIAYYVPVKSYTITNVGEYPTQINLCHNETKIVDGWQEPKNIYVETLDVGESIDWYVLDNYHFEIAEPTHITLEPIR